MKKVNKGDKVWLKPCGNNVRYGPRPAIEVSVEGVGRKYITVNAGGWRELKFDVETLRQHTQYIADYVLYLSKEDMDKEEETRLMWDGVSDAIRKRKISYEQLKAIHAIINNQQ